jgi:hypothetical protein
MESEKSSVYTKRLKTFALGSIFCTQGNNIHCRFTPLSNLLGRKRVIRRTNRLNMELDLQSLFGLHVT